MFLTAQDFVNSIGVGERLSVSDKWFEVFEQAIRHTRGDGLYELLEMQRPHESDFVREYRLQNIRKITKEGAVKFNDKAARIINGSHYTITNTSDELDEWLQNTSFQIGNGDTVGFNEYFTRYVLPCSFEDPNAIIVSFPYNGQNPDIAPAAPIDEGGLLENESVSVKPLAIASDYLWYVGNNVFSWWAGSYAITRKDGSVKDEPWYFIADRMNYYQYAPTGTSMIDGAEVVKYELFVWYQHDTGQGDENELPLNILGGTLTKDQKCGCTFYESFMQPYFEYGDETLIIFSDWQAVRTKTAFPVTEIVEQPCQSCSGHGKVQYREQGEVKYNQCVDCNGKGYIAGLSPFKDIIVDANKGFDNKNVDRPSIRYITPPLDPQQELSKDWKEMLKMAHKSINLDLLEETAESGEAKKQRLQDLQDMLIKIGGNLFDVMQRFLWYTECLLVPNRSERQMPVIIQPVSYEIKSEQMLRDEAMNAHAADAITALMEFNRRKYAGNRELIRIKELALMYAPLLAITSPQEIQLRLASGAYSESDIIKRDRAEYAISKIAKDIDIFDTSDAEIFAMVDSFLAPYLPAIPMPLVDSNGITDSVDNVTNELAMLEAESQAKLRGTVGGVQGIVQISQAVAGGTLTEAAAEKLLVNIYGFTEELARQIIDVPTQPSE